MCCYDIVRFICTGEQSTLVERCPLAGNCVAHARQVLHSTAVCDQCSAAWSMNALSTHEYEFAAATASTEESNGSSGWEYFPPVGSGNGNGNVPAPDADAVEGAESSGVFFGGGRSADGDGRSAVAASQESSRFEKANNVFASSTQFLRVGIFRYRAGYFRASMPTDGRPPNPALLSAWERHVASSLSGASTATTRKKSKKPRLIKTPKSERKAYRTVFDDVGLLVERPTSTLWFERGALAKVRAEQQIVIRATRTNFIFIDAEGAQHGVMEDEDIESETSEENTEPGEPKEEEAEGTRTSRQDSAAGAIPIDWNNPGTIDFNDVATRRACSSGFTSWKPATSATSFPYTNAWYAGRSTSKPDGHSTAPSASRSTSYTRSKSSQVTRRMRCHGSAASAHSSVHGFRDSLSRDLNISRGRTLLSSG
ncbi:hypothetical protein M409DRAFT_50577 [Zasmidium cellare ATCC 36951]|uniref:Uncharacterized protein n=1 Tax=Zasmidium cellare ATCC 36951 TaxID=1080233 RepID=A0A6A6D0I9_ZASCE|nr:uncharacterized protein M409DRAFT_50577 [Zasmidium cellare ATCC 36951]KAF2171970.1 hypothetical protein M409DRAFT_50577 [Zasmidium cellare ATCC 36951]